MAAMIDRRSLILLSLGALSLVAGLGGALALLGVGGRSPCPGWPPRMAC
jgi:hypothetical protein